MSTAAAASAGQVRVDGRYTIQCANEESLNAVESPFKLGPMDHLLLPFVSIAVVFVYKQPELNRNSKLISIERLQRALRLLLNYYPHLTGRLQLDPCSQTYEIARLGTGAELFVARCGARLDEMHSSSGRILMPNLPATGNALLAPFDPTVEGACRDPIFTIQHTRFACGGVSLGVRLNHKTCDSEGFFQLFRDLAEIYRGLSSFPDGAHRRPLARPPHIRSYLWEPDAMTPKDQQAALRFQPSMYHIEQRSDEEPDGPFCFDLPPVNPPVVGRVLRFSSRGLAALKAQAIDPSGYEWVSTFEALSAYLYQRVYRARLQLLMSQGKSSLEAASELSPAFLTPINLRGPTRLNLPARYFPNAVTAPYINVPHDLLADSPLWKVAKALHDWIRSFDLRETKQTIQWIVAQPDKSRIKQSFQLGHYPFIVSQWTGFSMYTGVDFDVDQHGDAIPPALVSPPFTPMSLVDGLALFLSTEEQLQPSSSNNRGAIDVNLPLSEPLWFILDQDEEFRKFQSN